MYFYEYLTLWINLCRLLVGNDVKPLPACLLWFDWLPRRTTGCKRSSYQRWCTSATGSGFLQRDEERFLVHGLVRRWWVITDRRSHEIREYANMCKIYLFLKEMRSIVFCVYMYMYMYVLYLKCEMPEIIVMSFHTCASSKPHVDVLSHVRI